MHPSFHSLPLRRKQKENINAGTALPGNQRRQQTWTVSKHKAYPGWGSPTVCILISAYRIWSYTVIKTVVLSAGLVNPLENSKFLLKGKFRWDLGRHSSLENWSQIQLEWLFRETRDPPSLPPPLQDNGIDDGNTGPRVSRRIFPVSSGFLHRCLAVSDNLAKYLLQTLWS